MALYNQNYEAKVLTTGYTYTLGDLGNGLTSTTIHQVFCLSDGIINMTAFGGGNFTWSAATSESIDILLGNCTVISGQFVGFKSHHEVGSQNPYYRP